MEPDTRYHNLLWGVRRSVRYHTRRRRFYDRLNTTASGVTVVFGSATFGILLSEAAKQWALAAAAVVTAVSAIDLVLGTAQMARLHHDLARRFIELEKRIVAAPNPDETTLSAWIQERLTIESDEPPPYRILDLMCHNELVVAEDRVGAAFYKVNWLQRFLANFFDLGTHKLTATEYQGRFSAAAKEPSGFA